MPVKKGGVIHSAIWSLHAPWAGLLQNGTPRQHGLLQPRRRSPSISRHGVLVIEVLRERPESAAGRWFE